MPHSVLNSPFFAKTTLLNAFWSIYDFFINIFLNPMSVEIFGSGRGQADLQNQKKEERVFCLEWPRSALLRTRFCVPMDPMPASQDQPHSSPQASPPHGEWSAPRMLVAVPVHDDGVGAQNRLQLPLHRIRGNLPGRSGERR